MTTISVGYLEEWPINVVKKRAADKVRTNADITASQVRVIDHEGNQLGVIATRDALQKAEDASLDLVEISPTAYPPVCRIMDYGNFLFEKNKKQAAAKKKQKQIHVKEVKFRPVTGEGDYQIKLRYLTRFLERGDKVKITVRFRGREMAHPDIGVNLLKRVQSELLEYGVVEQMPKREGRQMIMVMAPKKK